MSLDWSQQQCFGYQGTSRMGECKAGLGHSWGGRGFPGNKSIITCNATKSQLPRELGCRMEPWPEPAPTLHHSAI